MPMDIQDAMYDLWLRRVDDVLWSLTRDSVPTSTSALEDFNWWRSFLSGDEPAAAARCALEAA